MLTYSEIYDLLRKEKYSEVLQQLPKNFISDFSASLAELREAGGKVDDLFAESIQRSKKQLENQIAMFKELLRIRKKKLLSLVFVATETGLLKKDYENMLDFEKELFDLLVKASEQSDKQLTNLINGKKEEQVQFKLVLFSESVESFMDMQGEVIGPFKQGELAHIGFQVADILVSAGKATYVDSAT
ncbi:MAG TPA: hypothetical protein VJK51_05880 [Candidatus Nanoarchaeia archaeon]|nr:hypothetical protein [Candidatus Nanoarchaeia archaeon]